MLSFTPKVKSKDGLEKSWLSNFFDYLLFAVIAGLPALHYYGIVLWPAYITVAFFWLLFFVIVVFLISLLQNNKNAKMKFLSSNNLSFGAYYNLIALTVGGYFLFISGFIITAISFLTSFYILYIYNMYGSLRIYYERRKYRKRYNT